MCGAGAIAMILVWMWSSDPAPTAPVDIGGGIKLPTYVSGPTSHSWWAMVVLMLVAGSLYLAFVFSYLYLWTVSPQVWPKPDALPSALWPARQRRAALRQRRRSDGRPPAPCRRGERRVPASRCWSFSALRRWPSALAIEVWAQWSHGLRPAADAHAAMVGDGLVPASPDRAACHHDGGLPARASVRRDISTPGAA